MLLPAFQRVHYWVHLVATLYAAVPTSHAVLSVWASVSPISRLHCLPFLFHSTLVLLTLCLSCCPAGESRRWNAIRAASLSGRGKSDAASVVGETEFAFDEPLGPTQRDWRPEGRQPGVRALGLPIGWLTAGLRLALAWR